MKHPEDCTPATLLTRPQLARDLWGRVHLVGAGPGDAELLTLKAARRLRETNVVVYDNLVGDAVMALVPAGVARIFVGKQASNHTLTQERITELLLELVSRGLDVVRLKGGDPFVFGRGGEELFDLLEAGVLVDVVPGITAALGASAYSGIPLTHRDHAQSCVFVTGHRKADGGALDWPSLAQPHQTLVIYMGVGTLGEIASHLMAHGRDRQTPVALIQDATLAEQRVVLGTLADIAQRAEQAHIRPPALALIGEVAALYDPATQQRLAQARA